MSYPFGPEPYPTWGMVERCHTETETACWTEKNRLDSLVEKAALAPGLATDEMKTIHALSDCERMGLAFGHALDTAGVETPERFIQDLFSLMDEGLVERENEAARKREREYAEQANPPSRPRP